MPRRRRAGRRDGSRTGSTSRFRATRSAHANRALRRCQPISVGRAPDQGIGSAPTLKEGNPMIIYGGGGWKIWLAGLAVSLGIFAVLYFTVIKPTTDTANDAIKTSLKQSQQQLNEAKENAPSAQAK